MQKITKLSIIYNTKQNALSHRSPIPWYPLWHYIITIMNDYTYCIISDVTMFDKIYLQSLAIWLKNLREQLNYV